MLYFVCLAAVLVGCGIDLIVIWISCAWYYFVVSLVAGVFICLCGCYVSLVF